MTLNTTFLKTALLATVIGLSALPANAGGVSVRYGGGYNSCSPGGGYQVAYAGKITIDGYTTRIRADRSVATQISRAFRKAGYYAHTRNGCVIVDYGDCARPRVRWYADEYNLGMNWGYDSASFSFKKRYTQSYRSSHYGYNDWRRDRRHNSRRRWGSRRW